MVEAHEEAQKKTNDDENNATFIQIAMMLIVVAENKGETDNNQHKARYQAAACYDDAVMWPFLQKLLQLMSNPKATMITISEWNIWDVHRPRIL